MLSDILPNPGITAGHFREKGTAALEQDFLKKAKENLRIAQMSFEHQCHNACANRAYYACFQAAIAALVSRRAGRGKFDHKWVQAEFSRKLIKRQKIYPARLRSYLLEMQIIRNRADYEKISEDIQFPIDIVAFWIAQ
ncbi:MAG: hypothetical protein B6245_16765 [Desulfobacteraceae bacterium 4572_88]|nr:MAG: hypothetical protein B6245_16765 [Desulfobacteraceae bacterium 4572_88]